MLNTILHNPSVKDKIGADRFIDMNRGINAGGDLPPELLTVSKLLRMVYCCLLIKNC
jgi:Sec7-like guanine-nucleotide exchange factor